MKPSIIRNLVLIIPVLFFVFFIGQSESNKNNGTVWTVPITGYDPRDLLRGHYLQFTYNWDIDQNKESCFEENCCLCLNKRGEDYTNPKAYLLTCDKVANECESHIKGYGYVTFDNKKQFSTHEDIGRFYVSEEHAQQLDEMLQNRDKSHKFEIGLNVTDKGNAFIKSMTVDSQDFWLWIKNPKD